jgi:aspartate kinase
VNVIVQKYGGTSLATPADIRRIANRIVAAHEPGTGIVIVVSAMGDTTRALLKLARSVVARPPRRELDMLLTAGERVTMSLLSMAIQARGHEAISFTGSQSGIITDSSHTNARILEIRGDRIRSELAGGRIVIVAGFQGVSLEREVTTLGIGGSDITAVAVAVSLGAVECEIYTDVDGILTADPRVVPRARLLREITYDEMLELAGLGAQVLHRRAVEIAARNHLVLRVRSSVHRGVGTVIRDETLERPEVRGLTQDEEIALLSLRQVPRNPRSLSQVVTSLAREGVAVKFFFHGAPAARTTDLSFVVSEPDVTAARGVLESEARRIGAEDVVVSKGVGLVSVIGLGITSSPDMLARIFTTLARSRIHMDSVSTSETRVSCIIPQRAVIRAARALAREFDLTEAPKTKKKRLSRRKKGTG